MSNSKKLGIILNTGLEVHLAIGLKMQMSQMSVTLEEGEQRRKLSREATNSMSQTI